MRCVGAFFSTDTIFIVGLFSNTCIFSLGLISGVGDLVVRYRGCGFGIIYMLGGGMVETEILFSFRLGL